MPNSAIPEYRQFVGASIRLEAGLTSGNQTKSPHEILHKLDHPHITAETATAEASEERIIPGYHFFYTPSARSFSVSIRNIEEFKACAEKIGFGNIPPEDVWSKLQKLTTMTPREISLHYRDKVAGGPFQSWTQIHIGSTLMRIIFSVNPEENTITFKIGRRETIYETKRQKGKDKSRTL